MKALVLGGTGFIGPHVVRELHSAGVEVTVLHSGTHEADALPAAHLHAAWEATEELRRETCALRPDVVIAMALMTETAARSVLEAVVACTEHVVVVSSSDVYRAYGRLHGSEPGPVEPTPLTEESPLRERRYPYRGERPRAADDPRRWMDDYDKIMVEQTFRAEPAIRSTVLRLPLVHGPGSYRYYEYVKRMRDGRRAIPMGVAEARFRATRGYVEDVARAIARAAVERRAVDRVFNVGEPDGVAELDLVGMLAKAAGWNGEIVLAGADDVPQELRDRVRRGVWDSSPVQDLVLDTSRIRAEVGFTEGVLRSVGLERMVRWMEQTAPDLSHPVLRNDRFDYVAEDAVLLASQQRQRPSEASESAREP